MVRKKDYTGTIITVGGGLPGGPWKIQAKTNSAPNKPKLTPKSRKILKTITAKGFQTIE